MKSEEIRVYNSPLLKAYDSQIVSKDSIIKKYDAEKTSTSPQWSYIPVDVKIDGATVKKYLKETMKFTEQYTNMMESGGYGDYVVYSDKEGYVMGFDKAFERFDWAEGKDGKGYARKYNEKRAKQLVNIAKKQGTKAEVKKYSDINEAKDLGALVKKAYGDDPLYLNVINAKNEKEQDKAVEVLKKVRGEEAFKKFQIFITGITK